MLNFYFSLIFDGFINSIDVIPCFFLFFNYDFGMDLSFSLSLPLACVHFVLRSCRHGQPASRGKCRCGQSTQEIDKDRSGSRRWLSGRVLREGVGSHRRERSQWEKNDNVTGDGGRRRVKTGEVNEDREVNGRRKAVAMADASRNICLPPA